VYIAFAWLKKFPFVKIEVAELQACFRVLSHGNTNHKQVTDAYIYLEQLSEFYVSPLFLR
jgi:hypothetical protein